MEGEEPYAELLAQLEAAGVAARAYLLEVVRAAAAAGDWRAALALVSHLERAGRQAA